MRFFLQPLIVLLLAAYVFGNEKKSRSTQLKALFCDESHQELRSAVEKCFDDNNMDGNVKIKEVTEKCYPGITFPVTGETARKWHCENPDEKVEQSDVCMDKAFDFLTEDTEAMDLVVSLWECMIDAYDSHVRHRN